MLTAVEFDVQLRFFAEEIQIIIAKRMLTTELVAAKPPITEPAPQALFSPGFSLTKPAV